MATTRPTLSPFYTSSVFYSTTSTTTAPASRSQTIIDLSDLGNVAPLVAKSIAVRRPIGLGNSNPAMTTNATLVLSVSTALSSAATTTFATNYGASSTTVINTAISLPASVNQATWPAPWQPAFPFNAPFVIPPTSAGGSLVIDLTQVQTTGASSWYVEYTTPDLGGRSTNGAVPSQCKFSGGTYNNSLSYTTGGLRPSGGSWYVQYGGLQPNVIGVIALSAFGVDNKGTWPLPLDLTPLGATNCSFNVGLEIGFLGALTASASGTARTPTMTIPAGLGGSAFYDQTIWFDAAANTAGIVSGWSSKWSIGTGLGAPSAFVYATGNNHTSATGTMITGACPTWQIQ
ncbi:MAG: hypothetical protein KDC95_04015 [Planctomycetes bacterium]|nr:hypothetical protein [Planctomycetota bacterium]